MRVSIPKSLVAGVLSATILTNAPASAAMFHGGGGFGGFHGGFGGFHGGFGGFHGAGMGMGGFHPGGFGSFRPGFFHGRGFFHHGFAGRRVFVNRNIFVGGRFGCWDSWCGGDWWWPGFATGAVVGAAAAYPYYNSGDYGCWVYRPAYRHGVYVGRGLVNICN